MKQQGCKNVCDIDSPINSNGFCQSYPIFTIAQVKFYTLNPENPENPENLKWSIIYDSLNIDISPKVQGTTFTFYGIFKFNAGIYRFFDVQSTQFYSTYLIGLKISILLFNEIPLNCGIQFKINNTYFGSIYRNDSGIQTHKLKIYSTQQTSNSELPYSLIQKYELILYLDIPKSSILFSAIGNYTDNTAGWGMVSVQLTSGYCSQFCQLCEVSFKCKTCLNGYYLYRDGSCIQGCENPYQKKLNSTYCQDYDDETPYSQYLIQEYTNKAIDPHQYQQYTLVSQSGSNFLKGSDIYYSYWQVFRVFGGPFVWAQAKFQRIHNIIDPHHSITIAFYIIYGPQFPIDGKFIYQIENNQPISKSSSNYYLIQPDESKYDKIYEKISHNTNSLTISWECFGTNNEPIYAYCGFFNYYIAVHYCKPYCLECSDQNTCTSWNSTYDSNIVRFSQEECLSTQYFDRDSFQCFQCPISCLTCISKIDCKTCLSTYTLTKLGCICKINQYEDTNQCYDCPDECNQCLSSTYCTECLLTNNRKLINGQCNCIDGYYPIVSNPQCQQCHKFCETCFGPTNNECSKCSNIINIENMESKCSCPTNSYYEDALRTCSLCDQSCQTCFKKTIDGCLTCNSMLNRILKELKCECKPGYYDLSNICTNCPTSEDTTLNQCYKQCNNNQSIWHTIICNSCDSGFQLEFGECQPICGDLQIKGYEQCEDDNQNLNDLCYNCQFQCPIHCQTCDSTTTLPCLDICGDGIVTGIEECEDGNIIQYDGCYNCKYQCQPQCTKCIKGECFECATKGWYIDPTITPWLCKEKCGDLIVIGNEQCDDANLIDTDGCKDCKYYCRIGCSSCNYNSQTCLSCELPGFFPQLYYCKNICGDGLIVIDPSGINSEQCDDGNTINNDGCSSTCQFQCQPSTICLNCVNQRCRECALGYYLSSDQICKPICGDSQLVIDEICEITQSLPYKGCQNCQAKCQTSCQTCNIKGLGCNECKKGYKQIDYLCYSLCGDKIVTDDEQCDDGNLIYGDGCHFCQFACTDSCLYCIKGICYECQDGYQLIQSQCYPICGDYLKSNDEQCEVVDLMQSFQKCQACRFSCDVNCHFCFYGICQKCDDGYELSLNQFYCSKSLQNTQLFIENCEIQITNSCIKCQDNAYYDKIEQQCKSKNTPMDFCEYQLKLQPDFYCSQCFKYCDKCNENSCILCKIGYYLDESFQCNSFCGDGILAHDEQCEIFDQNCFICKYVAPSFCELYFENNCYKCEDGYYFNQFSNICESYCGDGIVVHDEECEDNNQLELGSCFNCKYQCQRECLDCLLGKCKLCESSYILVQSKNICEQIKLCEGLIGLYYDSLTNDCIPFCGDGIIKGYEQCDDKNYIPFDGCYECKYQCDEKCTNCQKGKCYECQNGYYLQIEKCITKCGDGIKIGNELCDDQNDISRDGCSFCKIDPLYKCEEDENLLSFCYKCQDNCNDCKYENDTVKCLRCNIGYFLKDNTCNSCSEKCEECINTPNNCIKCSTNDCKQCHNISGFYFDKSLKSCITKCGDNIIAGTEQCDDGNLIDFDGCNSKCEIEKKFICNEGLCYYIPQKQIDLTYSNSTTKNDLDLMYDDFELDGICNKLQIWIEYFQPDEFSYKIYNQENYTKKGQGLCQIKFNFFKTISEQNLIHLIVPLKDNETRILEDTREIIITPRKLVYYNDDQYAQAQNVVSTSSSFTFALQFIGPITIILGGFNIFWSILDILTWINNFYFLNVDYPLNVQLFFKKIEWGDIFNIPQIYNLNTPDDSYYFEAPPKFTEKEVNPLFLNNIQLMCVLTSLAFIAYCFSVCVVSNIQKKFKPKFYITHKIEFFQINQIQDKNQAECPKKTKKTKKQELPFLINIIYQIAVKFKINFRAQLLYLFGLVFFDICLACFLQLKYKRESDLALIKWNIALAIVGIILIILMFKLYSFVCSQHSILYESLIFQNQYSSLYEGLNTKTILGRNYCFVNLMRKTMFIFFTVYFYENPLLQTSFCCVPCFFNLVLILFQNPFQNKSQLFLQALPDLCIFIILLITTLLAVDDVSNILSFDQKYIIGWVILFFILLSILVQIIFLLKQFGLEIRTRFIQIKELISQKAEVQK
ncbi:unnamed protein product [Paramecium sonneborni]|uniref:EGF-like domain-containing protein n=1 Tax=Paramecium sonneborni TaxID=65129 RepID=A0A8S1L0K1_9CILI|nr:unnamed protein product [Paramecium sonneborni]